MPSNVTLPAGYAQLIIPIEAPVPGEAIVQASTGIVSAQAHIEVVDVTSLRVAPSSIVLAEGATETVHVSFAPPVAAPHTVALTARGPGAISFPASVVVPAGGTADVTLRAASEGWVAIDMAAGDLLTAATLLAEVVGTGAPAIDAVTPLFGQAGTRVTISGARFTDRCSVTFGDQPAAVESRTASLLTVIAPPNGGTVDVTVTCGAEHATKSRAFTYTALRRRPSR